MRAKNNQNDEEDNTGKIFFLYRKKCDSMGINILPSIKNILEKVIEQNKFDLVFPC
jgi:DNA replication protein DnaD